MYSPPPRSINPQMTPRTQPKESSKYLPPDPGPTFPPAISKHCPIHAPPQPPRINGGTTRLCPMAKPYVVEAPRSPLICTKNGTGAFPEQIPSPCSNLPIPKCSHPGLPRRQRKETEAWGPLQPPKPPPRPRFQRREQDLVHPPDDHNQAQISSKGLRTSARLGSQVLTRTEYPVAPTNPDAAYKPIT